MLKNLTPKVDTYIKDYQRIGADFLSAHKHALLADEMGSGKTLQAIVAMYQAPKIRALIICPATVKYNWKNQFSTWGYKPDIQVIESGKDVFLKKEVTIINYDQLIKSARKDELMATSYTHIISDEAHYLKSYKSKRTEAVLGVFGLRTRTERLWLITGTPVLNRPVELYPILKSLCKNKLKQYSSWIKYTRHFCNGHQAYFGYDVSGANHIDELSKLLDGFMLRRTKEEIMQELPDKTYEKIIVPKDKKYTDMYEALSNNIEKLRENGESPIGVMATMRRQIGETKIPVAIKHINDILCTKEKIVVFAYHRSVLKKLSEGLKGYFPVTLQGGDSSQAKNEAITQFINNPMRRVFIGNIEAAGTGIDGLQHVADTAIFVEMVYTPGKFHQACDRLHRQGQKGNVLIQVLTVEGTIDEDIIDAIEGKEKVIGKILKDGKGVTEFKGVTKQTAIIKRSSFMEKIAKVLEECVELIAKKVADQLLIHLAEKIEVPLKEPSVTGTKPTKQEKVKTIESSVDKPLPDSETILTEIKEIRGKLASYFIGKTGKEILGLKQAFNTNVGKTLRQEFNQISTDGLTDPQLVLYRDILQANFINLFGGDIWESIVQ